MILKELEVKPDKKSAARKPRQSDEEKKADEGKGQRKADQIPEKKSGEKLHKDYGRPETTKPGGNFYKIISSKMF